MKHSPAISAVLTDDNLTMASREEDVETESIDLLNLDPALEPYLDHFRYRMKKYVDQKMLIEKYEGALEEFSQGNSQKLCFRQFDLILEDDLFIPTLTLLENFVYLGVSTGSIFQSFKKLFVWVFKN